MKSAVIRSKRLVQMIILLALLCSSLTSYRQVYANAPASARLDATITERELNAWDATYIGYVSASLYEEWWVEFTEYHHFVVTVTSLVGDLTPLLILMDANGNEITRAAGTLTSIQPPGWYSVLVQPQAGSGFYTLKLQDVTPTQPNTTAIASPATVPVGAMTAVMVDLHQLPAGGYSSAEFTCTYDPAALQLIDILPGNSFGIDPVVAIQDSEDGQFIFAIAGSQGRKATASGSVFMILARTTQAGATTVHCRARVSAGDHRLTEIESTPASLTVLENTPTPDPQHCDQVQFIADVTVPEGTVFAPGQSFTKTWRLKNIGSCAWTTAYQLVFDSGELMGGPAFAAFPHSVQPGQVIDLSIHLTAPSVPGSYRGYWRFRNANGALFGIGSQANRPWWLEIRVSGPTVTPGGPTLTPSATVTPTIVPLACDKAEFITDITVPPGTVLLPGTAFRKTWRLKNVGTCTWTTSYRIALLGGDPLGAPSSVRLPVSVAPGEMVDLSLDMTAPLSPGTYHGDWILQNDTGHLFGIGALGNQYWIAQIVVSGSTFTPSPTLTATPSMTPGGPTATPIPGVVYDFAANMCAAMWFSNAGQLPCPGVDGNANGFVFRVGSPQLETGAIDPRPALLTFPQNANNGYIQGFYPPIRVQSGDRFRTLVTCEFNATNCYGAFRLDYQVGSDHIRTFWGPFSERYDSRGYEVDVDLSNLAGKDVKFILTVLAAGSATGDRLLWVGPVIYRPSTGSTSTPLASATITPSESATSAFTSNPTISVTPSAVFDGLISGQVVASRTVTIYAYDEANALITNATVHMDGSFALPIPPGRYWVLATAPGFLSAQGNATITNGNTVILPVIHLMPGDLDNNNAIDALDALTIGMNYNFATPTTADLNNDGTINVLDLELLARNYRRTGPVAWQ